jgi:uncharacterized protein (DUF924 family)
LSLPLTSIKDVLAYWFGADPDSPLAVRQRHSQWFSADSQFDGDVRLQFSATLAAADLGKLKLWKLTPQGTLALVLLFDQFSRNIHRGTALAYAYDQRALALTRDALAMGSDLELKIVERLFLYLPLEHAEDPAAQEKSVTCFEALHNDAPNALRQYTGTALAHARVHRDLINDFGRFPHRNLALDRASTAAENAWLAAHRGAYGQS